MADIHADAVTGPTTSGLTMIEDALNKVLMDRGLVAPSIEAQMQSALDLLRRAPCDSGQLRRAERISTMLFTLATARVSGRTNLQESQLLRLSRLAS